MVMSIYTISNLTCARGARTLFAPISFELNAGETLLLRGSNGSGKSTLLRTLAGFIPSTQAIAQLTSVYVGHANALHPAMTADEHLGFWRSLQPSSDISNTRILNVLGLAAQKNKLGAHLSNGQKRRLAFARLLLHPAQLWLLDEPQAALDTAGVQMLLGLLTQHQQLGGIAIIASHDALAVTMAHTLELLPLELQAAA
jgi:heme exporter protein A